MEDAPAAGWYGTQDSFSDGGSRSGAGPRERRSGMCATASSHLPDVYAAHQAKGTLMRARSNYERALDRSCRRVGEACLTPSAPRSCCDATQARS
jgi:hypothetical protein